MHIKKPHKCPVCGKYDFPDFDSYEICPECGWEDDWIQEKDPTEEVGSNEMCLNEYKAKYEIGWKPEWLKEQ